MLNSYTACLLYTSDPMDTSDTLSGGVQRMMMDGLFGFDENMQKMCIRDRM